MTDTIELRPFTRDEFAVGHRTRRAGLHAAGPPRGPRGVRRGPGVRAVAGRVRRCAHGRHRRRPLLRAHRARRHRAGRRGDHRDRAPGVPPPRHPVVDDGPPARRPARRRRGDRGAAGLRGVDLLPVRLRHREPRAEPGSRPLGRHPGARRPDGQGAEPGPGGPGARPRRAGRGLRRRPRRHARLHRPQRPGLGRRAARPGPSPRGCDRPARGAGRRRHDDQRVCASTGCGRTGTTTGCPPAA